MGSSPTSGTINSGEGRKMIKTQVTKLTVEEKRIKKALDAKRADELGTVMLAKKIYLKPNKEQEQLFYKYAGAARYVYNRSLDYMKFRLSKDGYVCKHQDLQVYIQSLKYGNHKWLQEVPEAVQSRANLELIESFSKLFNAGFGFPHYRSRGRTKVAFYQKSGQFRNVYDTISGEFLGIKLTKIPGPVKVLHKDDRVPDSKVYNPKIVYDGFRWYLAFVVDVPKEPFKGKWKFKLGCDLGIEKLATLSDGRYYANINKKTSCSEEGLVGDIARSVAKLEERRSKLQRILSRKYKAQLPSGVKSIKGVKLDKTNNIIKLERKLGIIKRKLANIRDTYTHTVTKDIISPDEKQRGLCRKLPGTTDLHTRQYYEIVIEDLTVKKLIKNSYLTKQILDCDWYRFRQYLNYKGKRYGTNIVVVPRTFASSQICHACGSRQKMPLKIRTYNCTHCKVSIDRDLNAALNLRDRTKLLIKDTA